MSCFSFFCKKILDKKSCKVANDDEILDEEILDDEILDEEILDEEIYYKFLINIRNYVILSSDDMCYIKTLSKDNLIKIINIYNLHIINITSALATA